MWRRGEAGKGDARKGEGSGYFIKCWIINTLIWDGRGGGQGQGQGQEYYIKCWCYALGREGREKGERRERGTGTDERDWDSGYCIKCCCSNMGRE